MQTAFCLIVLKDKSEMSSYTWGLFGN